MRYIFLFLSISMIFSCKSKEKIVEPMIEEEPPRELEKASSDSDLGKLQLSYSKGACFGQCPVFTMQIYENGFAQYNGKLNTEKMGLWQLELTKAQVKRIENALKKADLANKPTEYESMIADLPRTTYLYYQDDNEKRVTAKEGFPEEILALNKVLDEITRSKDWKVIDGKLIEEAEPEYNYDEIIVKFKKGVGLPPWFRAKKEIGIYLQRKVAPDQDFWIVGYKKELHQPEEILKILREDEDIESAEFNKVVSKR